MSQAVMGSAAAVGVRVTPDYVTKILQHEAANAGIPAQRQRNLCSIAQRREKVDEGTREPIRHAAQAISEGFAMSRPAAEVQSRAAHEHSELAMWTFRNMKTL